MAESRADANKAAVFAAVAIIGLWLLIGIATRPEWFTWIWEARHG
jgi:hypothetical protein